MISGITDEMLMQSTLLALTMQNVTGDMGGTAGEIYGDMVLKTDGWVDGTGYIYGDYGSLGE